MKKKIAILLSCVCIAFPALTYAQSNIQVKLDGNYVKFSGQEPTVINNRTMVPLRGIFENLGYSIEWDADTKTATLKKDNKSISIQTGADSFSVNGVGKKLDVPAQILNGSLMLPLRAIGEAAGLSVVWDSNSKTVVMTNIAQVTNISTDSKEDIKKYLDEIQIYNNNEDYIMEIIRYYMNNQQLEHAKQYYKEHIQNIRTKETKAKLESLLNPENEDAYLNYLCSKLSYYNCSEVPIYYDDLKEFYGNKFENYLIDFINKVDDYYSDYELAIMFKRKQEAKYAIYILLQKPNMNFFDPLKGMIKEYSLEMYLMVYVECLKDYINQGIRNYYLRDYIYDLFHELDEMSKIELVDMLKKEYPRKKKLHEMLDACLKEDDEIEIQY